MHALPLWWREWRWRRRGRRVAARRLWETFLAWADSHGLVQPIPQPVRLAIRWAVRIALVATAVGLAAGAWYFALHLFFGALRLGAE